MNTTAAGPVVLDGIIAGIRDLRRRCDELERLATAEAEAAPRVFSTIQLGKILGRTPEALSAWARRAGPGAVRAEGWKLLGRNGSGYWQWQPVEEAPGEPVEEEAAAPLALQICTGSVNTASPPQAHGDP